MESREVFLKTGECVCVCVGGFGLFSFTAQGIQRPFQCGHLCFLVLRNFLVLFL